MKYTLIELCKKDECTGCQSCYNICPTKCIKFELNKNGFFHPEIDHTNCIKCGLCMVKCPILNKEFNAIRFDIPKVYACWHNENTVRGKSTSGGAFSALAKHVLDEGGVVFGACYNKNMEVFHAYINSYDEIDKLRRSKYVQSSIGNSYLQVKEFLKKNKLVLFTGTPCQIAGLYSFLSTDFENLITAEIICHGVPSPLVHEKFISYIEFKTKLKVIDINFRDKKNGWGNGMQIRCTFTNGKNKLLRYNYSSYIKFFLNSINLRESCYKCNFKSLPKQADFTLGDFWGIGSSTFYPFESKKKLGISLLMIHSKKANDHFIEIANTLNVIERTYEEAINANPSFYNSQEKHYLYDEFSHDLNAFDFDYLIKKYSPLSLRRIIYELISLTFGAYGLEKLIVLSKKINLKFFNMHHNSHK